MKAPALTDKQTKNFWDKIDRRGADECWPWTGAMCSRDGNYGTFWVGSGRGNGKLHRSTKIALGLVSGVWPDVGQVVMHTCDNPPCCNPAHLVIGTHKENAADMNRKRRGNKPSQEEHRSNKLTADEVNEIRVAYRMGVGTRALSSVFPVARTVLRDIVSGKKWVSACQR